MQNYQIINNLHNITTSRLCSIGKLYSIPSVETSNVLRLYKALQSINKEDRVEARVVIDISFEEVLDMSDALQNGVDSYKLKYKVRTFPKDINIYQLIEALNKVDAKQLIKDIIIESAPAKSKSKTKEINDAKPKKMSLLERRRIELLNRNL